MKQPLTIPFFSFFQFVMREDSSSTPNGDKTLRFSYWLHRADLRTLLRTNEPMLIES
jgi:hypothetical protein